MSATVRLAQPRDLLRLESIENAADVLLVDLLRPASWPPSPSGAARASMSGFVLVVAETIDGDAVGFVHVLESDGIAHLEQLSVLPAHGRQGLGRALVEAATTEAARRGYERITLRTYADVLWNAPFYSTCGFVPSEPDTKFLHDIATTETHIGLPNYGRRIQMTARTTPEK
jgi:GNAT superfamily N-acetyltransferase